MFCQKCGKENPDTNQFCGTCGESLVKISQPIQKKASNEERIDQVKNKIAESKKDLEASSDAWPAILFILGVLLIFGVFLRGNQLIFGAGRFILPLGFFLVLLAVIWINRISDNEKKLRDSIFQYEGELYDLEKEP